MNTTINLRGIIHKIESKTGNRMDGSGWEVRTVVLWEAVQKQDGSTFDKYVAIDFMKPDLIKIIDANIYPQGTEVEIRAEISSRDVRGNWWTGLRGSDIREPYTKAEQGTMGASGASTMVAGTASGANTAAAAQSNVVAGATVPEAPLEAAEQEELPF